MGRQPFSSLSRRSFLQASTAASAALALRIVTEPMLAYAALPGHPPSHPKDAVLINANENPLGPSKAALDAIVNIAPTGGRYDLWGATPALAKTFADQHGLKPENVAVDDGLAPEPKKLHKKAS